MRLCGNNFSSCDGKFNETGSMLPKATSRHTFPPRSPPRPDTSHTDDSLIKARDVAEPIFTRPPTGPVFLAPKIKASVVKASVAPSPDPAPSSTPLEIPESDHIECSAVTMITRISIFLGGVRYVPTTGSNPSFTAFVEKKDEILADMRAGRKKVQLEKLKPVAGDQRSYRVSYQMGDQNYTFIVEEHPGY